MNYLNIAMRVVDEQAQALNTLKNNLPADFERLINHIITFSGRVILTGIGKSGYIAHKIAASFSSTGTASFFIHPAEASHGDLGMITEQDLVIMLSNSGETKELSDIINYCKRFAIKIVGVTMKVDSTLANNSDFLLAIPLTNEASQIAAPTTSALLMLALGDALTIAVQEAKGFSKDDFRLFHPGGKIGANLLKVSDVMRTKENLPLVFENTSFSETIITITNKGLGCALIINEQTKELVGLISDGDLRRHINDKIELKYAKDVMTLNPVSIPSSLLASEALFIMNSKAITVLPVTKDDIVEGAIHIHDILKAGVG